MYFDKLCGLVERHFPQFRKIMEEANIFVFPGIPHEALPKKLENVEFMWEHFFLPFQTIAIEDPASVIVLHDERQDAVGLNVDRRFIECMPFTGGKHEAFYDGELWRESIDAAERQIDFPNAYIIISGKIKMAFAKETNYLSTGYVDFMSIASKDKILMDDKELFSAKRDPAIIRPSMHNTNAALEEVMFFNSPDRFILEEEILKPKHHKKGKKILRSGDRSKFTILYPNEIRTRLHLPPLEVGGPKQPHPRRRHYRTLRSDVFVHQKGKVLIIAATWVGPKFAIVGNRKFIVRLDL